MIQTMKWSDIKSNFNNEIVFPLVREKIKVKQFSALILGGQAVILSADQIQKVIKMNGKFFITMSSGDACMAHKFFTSNNKVWAENFILKSLQK